MGNETNSRHQTCLLQTHWNLIFEICFVVAFYKDNTNRMNHILREDHMLKINISRIS